ncbi:MAG: hypothetical protein AAFX87_10960 [Bacteroidota bacterium]
MRYNKLPEDFLRPTREDQLIHSQELISLHRIGKNSLHDFSRFVFDMYSYHYQKKYEWQPLQEDFEEAYHEDISQFDDSVYFAFKDMDGKILGTIKTTLRQNDLTFPIEKDFNINIEDFVNRSNWQVDQVWHLGRLAIDSYTLRGMQLSMTSKEMFRQLLIHSLSVINHQPGNLMIAESDVLIYRLFHELGVNMQIIGDVKDYMGSPTYPVVVTSEDLESWLTQNEHQSSILQPA